MHPGRSRRRSRASSPSMPTGPSDALVIIRGGGSATDDDLAPALPRSIAAARISRGKRPEGCPHLPCAHFSESR